MKNIKMIETNLDFIRYLYKGRLFSNRNEVNRWGSLNSYFQKREK